eukprot:229873-Rhodomonas_salina.3
MSMVMVLMVMTRMPSCLSMESTRSSRAHRPPHVSEYRKNHKCSNRTPSAYSEPVMEKRKRG